MSREKSVYLCGPIAGLTYEDAANGWRRQVANHLMLRGIECYSPMRAKRYLEALGDTKLDSSHNAYSGPLSCDRGITARDRLDTTRSSLIIANLLGAERVSIGSMIELGWADAFRVPVLAIMEEEGNVHDHGMVRELIDFRVDTVEEAIELASAILMPGG